MEEAKKTISAHQQTQKSYPIHGIIGSSPPGWLDLGSLHRNPSSSSSFSNHVDVKKGEFRRKKLDLENNALLNQCNSIFCPQHSRQHSSDQPKMPDWNEGKKTSQVYPEIEESGSKLPDRFDNPSWFKGYGCEAKQHPFYITTSQISYGRFPPNVHTMPVKYCPMKNVFSEHLTCTGSGTGRNRSLNIK